MAEIILSEAEKTFILHGVEVSNGCLSRYVICSVTDV
jgi:hypothetical protein